MDKKIFKTRTLFGLLYGIIFIGLHILHPISFFILLSILHFGIWKEYINISYLYFSFKDNFKKYYYISMSICAYSVLVFVFIHFMKMNSQPTGFISFFLVTILFIILSLMDALFNKEINFIKPFTFFFGLIYLTVPFLGWIMLYFRKTPYQENSGGQICLLVILSVWLTDTFAYIVGSLIGKTPFFASISPKKTWEGTIGGALLTLSILIFISPYIFPYLLLKEITIIVTLSSLFGIIGDLFESKLKRLVKIKSSGKFLPEHGGFLDRLDSLLFAYFIISMYYLFK